MLPQLDAGVGLDLNGPVWEMFNFLFLTFSSNVLQDFHMNIFRISIFSKGLMSSFLYCRSACDSTLEITMKVILRKVSLHFIGLFSSCTDLMFELLLERLNPVLEGFLFFLVGFLYMLQLFLQCSSLCQAWLGPSCSLSCF